MKVACDFHSKQILKELFSFSSLPLHIHFYFLTILYIASSFLAWFFTPCFNRVRQHLIHTHTDTTRKKSPKRKFHSCRFEAMNFHFPAFRRSRCSFRCGEDILFFFSFFINVEKRKEKKTFFQSMVQFFGKKERKKCRRFS